MSDTPEPLTVEQSRPNLGFAVLAVVKYQRRCGMLRVEPDLGHEVYAAYEKALDTLIAAARREMRDRAAKLAEDEANRLYDLALDHGQGSYVEDVAEAIASLPLETPNP
jgi:hypothetical protein